MTQGFSLESEMELFVVKSFEARSRMENLEVDHYTVLEECI